MSLSCKCGKVFSTSTCKPEHTFLSIIDFAYFQLRFDALSCSEVSYPKYHNIITLECLLKVSGVLERDIKEALSYFIDRECRCGFEPSLIDQGEFLCHHHSINYRLTPLLGLCVSKMIRNQFLYPRARIIGSAEIQSSHQLIEILRKWKSSDGTFVFTGRRRSVRVWVDPPCPLKIDSFAAEICVD